MNAAAKTIKALRFFLFLFYFFCTRLFYLYLPLVLTFVLKHGITYIEYSIKILAANTCYSKLTCIVMLCMAKKKQPQTHRKKGSEVMGDSWAARPCMVSKANSWCLALGQEGITACWWDRCWLWLKALLFVSALPSTPEALLFVVRLKDNWQVRLHSFRTSSLYLTWGKKKKSLLISKVLNKML